MGACRPGGGGLQAGGWGPAGRGCNDEKSRHWHCDKPFDQAHVWVTVAAGLLVGLLVSESESL